MAGVLAPFRAVIVEDGACIPDRENVAAGIPPDTVQDFGSGLRTGGCPHGAVVMQDCPPGADHEYVGS